MSYRNGAYSAPKGYDLRAPYNVPLGEFACLRVVEPFSPSSRQDNTVTTKLPNSTVAYPDGPSFPRQNRCPRSFKTVCDPSTGELFLAPAAPDTDLAETNLQKLIYKGPIIR